MLKIGLSNFQTAVLGLQPKCRLQRSIEALRAIPHYRIQLETDSPYMPLSMHHGTNTPAYLGDIACMDAHHRRLSMEELLALSVASDLTSNLYHIVF